MENAFVKSSFQIKNILKNGTLKTLVTSALTFLALVHIFYMN